MPGALSLSGRTVVVGVTGGIAAYKSAEVVRWLKKEGAAVAVVMTPAARRFVAPLTLETLSGNPVVTSLWRAPRPLDLGPRPPERVSPVEHIELADAAHAVVVAPATADFLAKMALGLADDALSATLLAMRAPIVVAPAMNVNMWNHPATQANLERLRERGVLVLEPEEGELACRWQGKGRLVGVEAIASAVREVLARAASLAGRRIVVTAGPTREAVDAVRFLSNRSSGRMGVRLAESARDRGAEVTLVHGPLEVGPPAGVRVVAVTSAEEMREAVHAEAGKADAVVMAAAVADFRPTRAARGKLERRDEGLELRLEATPDILKEMPRHDGLVVVGFALETENGLARARRKLAEKKCDLMVLNDATELDSAFGGETNRVTLVGRDGTEEALPVLTKREVAERIWDRVAAGWNGGGKPASRRR
jgi:phosphopantothenoylcysteine decarboxylase/phosphopantothenate--cysteine ligase